MGAVNIDHSGAGDGVTITAVGGSFKVNGAAPAGFGPSGTVSGSGTIDVSSGSVFALTPTDNVVVNFSNVPSNSAGSVVLAYTAAEVTEKYVVDPTTLISNGGYFPSQFKNIRWANNGSLLLVASGYNGLVYSIEALTPYDPLSITGLYQEYNTGFGPASDIWMSDDGLTMIVSGYTAASTKFRKYTLGTAFNITTAVYQNGGDLGYSEETFDFSPDGNYIYTTNGQRVAVHMLPSPYQVNGGSTYVNYIYVDGNSGVRCVRISASGTKIVAPFGNTFGYFTVSNNYSFGALQTVAWDVYGKYVAWGDSGAVLTLVSADYRTYSAEGASALATLSFASSVKWPSGSAPTPPTLGNTDVYSFSTPDSGTTWYGQVIGQTFA